MNDAEFYEAMAVVLMHAWTSGPATMALAGLVARLRAARGVA